MNNKQHIDVEVQEGIYMRQPLDYAKSTDCHCGGTLAEMTSLHSCDIEYRCIKCDQWYKRKNSCALSNDFTLVPVSKPVNRAHQPLDYVPRKTTHKQTTQHTHCHGGWVVAALLIGIAIGFVFGVVR